MHQSHRRWPESEKLFNEERESDARAKKIVGFDCIRLIIHWPRNMVDSASLRKMPLREFQRFPIAAHL